MRIVKWQHKLVYAGGYWVTAWAYFGALRQVVPAGALAVDIFGSILDLGAILLGARIFRGRNEDQVAPRAWWRMTSKPKLSRRLGVVLTILTTLFLAAIAQLLLGGSRSADPLRNFSLVIQNTVFVGILAFLYTNSSVRMKRLGITSDPKRTAPLISDLSKPKFPPTS